MLLAASLIIDLTASCCHVVNDSCYSLDVFLTRLLLLLQVKLGGEIKLEPLSASLVRSVAAVTSQVTVMPGNSGIRPERSTAIPHVPAQQQGNTGGVHQERALRYFSMTRSEEPQLNSFPLLPESRESVGDPTSSAGLKQQWEEQERRVEEVRGRLKGGARQESGSIKGKLHSPDRERDGRQHQHHPHVLHPAEPSAWRGESEPLPGWRAADSQESRERGRGGYLRETAAAHSSEQERSRSQAGRLVTKGITEVKIKI